MYMRVLIYMHINVCTHVYIRSNIKRYIHTYVYMYLCKYVCVHLYTHQEVCVVHTAELPHTHTTQINLHMALKDNVYSIYLYIYIRNMYIYIYIPRPRLRKSHLKPHELLFLTKLKIP